MFIDEVKIKVKAGDGGNGCLAFRREKFVPLGGPYGGNGGKGGSIIFKADSGLNTLADLAFKKEIKAGNGSHGEGKNKHGKDASDLIIKVPMGTVVTDLKTGNTIAILNNNNDEKVIATGGRGGRGNTAFKTASNPAPNYSENGAKGEIKNLKVELKLLADAALVGFPSVGKSTIINKITNAKAKVADYHFTTLKPKLGVVYLDNKESFVISDLPGLIEGASDGAGLGFRFLRHIERCKIIVHVVDASHEDVIGDYKKIREELYKYSPKLSEKNEIVVLNKMDIEGADKKYEELKNYLGDTKIYKISAIKNEGMKELCYKINEEIKNTPLEESKLITKIYDYKTKDKEFIIEKVNDTFVVSGEKIKKLYDLTNFNTYEGEKRFLNKLNKEGLDDRLRDAGIKTGDLVQIYDLNYEYKD